MKELIEKFLKKYPKAKKIAVENFVWTAPDDKTANIINLQADAKAYIWNVDTQKAIYFCLKELNKI